MQTDRQTLTQCRDEQTDRLKVIILSLPSQTALKMLDCNFPDEHVRRFAVTALDEMPDEQLEDILLQLTQVREAGGGRPGGRGCYGCWGCV